MSRYPEKALNEILELELETEPVAPEKVYTTAGIYSYGKGLFKRASILGAETKYKKFTRLREGQFVYSKLFGWEGALATVEKEFDGLYVSHEFPTFAIDGTVADLAYIRHLARWEGLHAKLRDQGTGMGSRRQRVNIDRLLRTTVPLPDLEEQRRIATRLDELLVTTGQIAQKANSDDQKVIDLALASADQLLDQWASGTVPVGQVCTIVNDLVRPGEDPMPAKEFVGLEHIRPHLGERIESRPLGEETGRKFRFAPGDILYGYLRPYLNKVWVADRHGLCSVEQYVLRPNGKMPAELIAQALRGRRTLNQAIALTNNLQLPRLRSSYLLTLEIPQVPESHHDAALKAASKLSRQVNQLFSLKQRQQQAASSLRPALLNAAFNGQL